MPRGSAKKDEMPETAIWTSLETKEAGSRGLQGCRDTMGEFTNRLAILSRSFHVAEPKALKVNGFRGATDPRKKSV